MKKNKNYFRVSVPIYSLNPDGSIKPNPLFHRPWDKLHSRCIEYPYAASKITNEKRILDVGIAKADQVWIDWLEALPIEVHGTDYDELNKPLENIIFTQGDVRHLPYEDNFFDVILAVSVIEHIGLDDAQVNAASKPAFSTNGDLEAVQELTRILRPGGKLIMTFPYSNKEFIYANSARVYSMKRINKFNKIINNISYEYYEYQYRNKVEHFEEFSIKQLTSVSKKNSPYQSFSKEEADMSNLLPGKATWRKIDINLCAATHDGHIDGVYCGVWKK